MKHTNDLSPTAHRVLGLFYVVVTCFFIQACNSNTKETQPEENIEKEITVDVEEKKSTEDIIAQEKKWAEALVANDMNTVASIMHRDFRLIRAYGNAPPISKDMYLGMEGMSASSADVTSVNVSEEMDSIVVARITMTLDWEQEGVGKLPPHFDMIDIWKKNNSGMWQILSRVSQIAENPYSDKENTD